MKLWKQLTAGVTGATLLLGAAGTPLLQTCPNTAHGILFEMEEKTTADGFVYTRAFDYVNGKRIDQDGMLICGYVGTDTEIVIPAELDGSPVTYIGSGVFTGSSVITSVVIPGSVTIMGDRVFADCDNLSAVVIADGVTRIPDRAFSGCISLTSVTIPDSVGSIGTDAFACTGISCACENSVIFVDGWAVGHTGNFACDLVLPSTTRGIANKAFMDCTTLTTVTMGNSVKHIGNYAFSDCTALTAATLSNNMESIGKKAFNGCDALQSVTVAREIRKTIATGATPEVYVAGIGENAFAECKSLTSVTIPDGITSIGQQAFYRCDALAAVTIPDGVTNIGNQAFTSCCALTSVQLPAHLERIGYATFHYCTALTTVTIPAGITEIGPDAFCNCTALTEITIPDGVTCIGSSAFIGCTALSALTLPVSLTRIGESAFGHCTGLSDVFYAGAVEQWNAIAIEWGNEPLIYNTVHFRSTGAAIAPVTNFKVVSGNAITWTKSAEAVKYYIFQDGQKIAETRNTSYVFQTLTPGTYYEIGVCAVNAAGEQSKSCKAYQKAVAMPEKPTGLSRGTASFCWNAVPGAKSYKVYVINPKNGKYVKTVAGVKGTSFTYQGMQDGSSYRLRVCAVDENGVLGKYASTKVFTYQAPAVAPVTNLKNVSGNAVSWTKTSDAVSYFIYLDGKKVSATRNASFAFQTLTPGTTYKVGIAAVNAAGKQSPIVSVKLEAVSLLNAPTGLRRNGLTLSWNAVEGAKNYKVYLMETDAKGRPLYVDYKTISGRSYTFDKTKLEAGKTYKLRVCAVDKNGNLGTHITTKAFTA